MVQLSIELLSLLAKHTIPILSPVFFFHLLTTKGHNHPCLLTVSWSTHRGCFQRLPRSPFYYSLQTSPCPFSWTIPLGLLLPHLQQLSRPTQYSHIMQSAKEHGWFAGTILPISQPLGFKHTELKLTVLTSSSCQWPSHLLSHQLYLE